jgi:hypothetical protein
MDALRGVHAVLNEQIVHIGQFLSLGNLADIALGTARRGVAAALALSLRDYGCFGLGLTRFALIAVLVSAGILVLLGTVIGLSLLCLGATLGSLTADLGGSVSSAGLAASVSVLAVTGIAGLAALGRGTFSLVGLSGTSAAGFGILVLLSCIHDGISFHVIGYGRASPRPRWPGA